MPALGLLVALHDAEHGAGIHHHDRPSPGLGAAPIPPRAVAHHQVSRLLPQVVGEPQVDEEVQAPARYEVRETVRYERGRRVVIRERVLVEPACTRRIARNVCVSEGRWDVIEKRVCVTPGRWEWSNAASA